MKFFMAVLELIASILFLIIFMVAMMIFGGEPDL